MKTKPTFLQVKAVDNILSGNFKSVAAAMREAGYSESTSFHALEKLGKSKGIQAYLKLLGADAIKRWGITIEEKVAHVYLDGLDAERPSRRKDVQYPDWKTRLVSADKISEFLGWVSK